MAKIFLNEYLRHRKSKHIIRTPLKNLITRATNRAPLVSTPDTDIVCVTTFKTY